MKWDTWALDVGMELGDGVHCFVPLEPDNTAVIGMNWIDNNPPASCRHLAVIHPDGQEACEKWVSSNRAEIDRIKAHIAQEPPQ